MLQPTSETIEAAIREILAHKPGGPFSQEIDHNSQILHAAPSYHHLQAAAHRSAAGAPDHEGCIFIQIGFFLGLQVARKLLQ